MSTEPKNEKWPVWENSHYVFPTKWQMFLCIIGQHDWFHGFYHKICNRCGDMP